MKNPKKKFEGWPTTRCYPRTLAEAFPKDPENYQWFHPPVREQGKLEIVLLSVGFWVWLGLAYWWAN
jgi:hypothetical protein